MIAALWLAALWLGTFVASVLSVRAFVALSRRWLLDAPGGRSSHALPTPTGGGFPAVLCGLASSGVAIGLGLAVGGPRAWLVALAVIALGTLGLLDDAIGLPRSLRYGAHLLVAVAAVVWLGALTLGPLGLALALLVALGITGLINGFNFMDGIDGLVGGTGCVILAFLGFRTGDSLWLLFAAAYAGFLALNLPPARVFMGDAGSTTLGGLVGIALWSGREQLAWPDLAVLVPLLGDATYTLARRLLRGENVLVAHHSHVYQRLLRAGLSHGRISLAYALATTLAALSAIGWQWSGAATSVGACVLAAGAVERYLGRKGVPFARPLPETECASRPRVASQ